MLGKFAQPKEACTVSAAKRAALIARIVVTLGTQYSGLRKYRSL